MMFKVFQNVQVIFLNEYSISFVYYYMQAPTFSLITNQLTIKCYSTIFGDIIYAIIIYLYLSGKVYKSHSSNQINNYIYTFKIVYSNLCITILKGKLKVSGTT